MDLNKKVVFVTGSSIGLGKGLVEELSKNGCNVVIGYNNSKEKAECLKKYIEEKYGQLEKQLTDLFDRSEKPVNRAVMAHILSELPVFFGNVEEIKNYVYRSLNACTDLAEKAAVVQILESMMQEE